MVYSFHDVDIGLVSARHAERWLPIDEDLGLVVVTKKNFMKFL